MTQQRTILPLYAHLLGTGKLWETKFFYNAIDKSHNNFLELDPLVCNLGLSPFSISNGILTITAQSTAPSLTACGITYPYTGGHLDTYYSFSQAYGYWETRAKISNVYGTIFAFWAIPENGAWRRSSTSPRFSAG